MPKEGDISSQSAAAPPPETPSAPAHGIGRGLAPARETTTAGTPSLHPEMMLGLWTAWVESISKLASDMGGAPGGLPGQAAWQMSPDQLTGGLQQLGELAAKDSILNAILRATDDALNLNPLRQVIPVDWAEIARALRTVWLRSISRPERTMAAAADFNLRQGQTSLDTWNEAWQRWYGVARLEPAAASADKRFAAPEWQGNPVYRTLKELYLLASDWLLRQASEGEDLSPAEQQHLDFHLRQFVDAMSSHASARLKSCRTAPGGRDGRREPCGGNAQPDARPQGGPAKHGRCRGIRAGAQPRALAGQGGLPQQTDRAHPVRAKG